MTIRYSYMKNYLYIFFVSALMSLPMTIYGTFQDSAVYYEHANIMWDYGVINGIKNIILTTGKFEPFTPFIFYIQGGVSKNETFFLFLNLFLCNFIILYMYNKIIRDTSVKIGILFFLLISSSYFVFSNVMYVWRSIYAVFFMFLFVLSKGSIKRSIFFILSILSHKSVILFYLMFFVTKMIKSTNRKTFLFFSLLTVLIMHLVIKNMSFLSLFVAGGNLDVFLSSSGDTWIRIIVNLFAIFVLMLSSYSDIRFELLWRFAMLGLFLSTAFYFNWQLMSRVALPALLLTPFLVLISNGRYKKYAIICLSCSIFPTLRLIFLFISGGFLS